MSDRIQPASSAVYRHARLNELARLEADWDSYGAPPLTEAALRTADALVFIPTGEGGVQIELHAAGAEVEVTIGDDGHVEAIYVSGDVSEVEDERHTV